MRSHYNIKRALTSLYVVVGFGMIASCGNNRQAKAVVNDFLEENLNTQDYDTEYFSNVDSTFVVSDSVLQKMQTNAKSLKMFKSLRFAERGNTKKLYIIKTRYHIGADTIRQVFYLNEGQTQVVCVKQDV